jgi:invasion protein IalB
MKNNLDCFKVGDYVRFVIDEDAHVLNAMRIDTNIAYKVTKVDGYQVSIDLAVIGARWGSGWFVLDKKAIVKDIIKDLL